MSVPQIISVFNNKGGVGKTTLTYHLAHALAEMGKNVLIVDMDPQCNLTIYAMDVEEIHRIWLAEDSYIDSPGYAETRKRTTEEAFQRLNTETRTIHFLLKPTEEGRDDLLQLPPPKLLRRGLSIVPGRLTLHMYEERVARRWSEAYTGDPLAIRTLTRTRSLIQAYGERHDIDIAIVDTSPSLGALNKVVISTVDAFFVPCFPDIFSLYGIRNIGNALRTWHREFDTLYKLLSDEKRSLFPPNFVRFLGYTIYNARPYAGLNPWDLAKAHYHYAESIPKTISDFVPQELWEGATDTVVQKPIGGTSVMHTHNTLPAMAQKYHHPIWEVPGLQTLEREDALTIRGNRKAYEATKGAYIRFAQDLLTRLPAHETR
jgi:cellulose biosynthesis protein BcsQ